MDIIVIAIVAALGYAAWKFWPKVADVNNDGKVDAVDAVEAVKKTTTRAKKVVDKNASKIATKSQKTEK